MSLYDTLDGKVLKKPGDYVLSDIRLISYRSVDGSNTPDAIEIETLVLDMNIYESIYNKTLSGNMLIVDGNNVIGKLPLTGNERLEFKFFTPSLGKGYDFTMKSVLFVSSTWKDVTYLESVITGCLNKSVVVL